MKKSMTDIEEVGLYFESHITIDPVFDERRKVAQLLAALYGFRLAKLIMRKGSEETDSQDDTFMTATSDSVGDLGEKTIRLVETLKANDFVVRRYKIEMTIMDSRMADELNLL